jgi:hypothetical protein
MSEDDYRRLYPGGMSFEDYQKIFPGATLPDDSGMPIG